MIYWWLKATRKAVIMSYLKDYLGTNKHFKKDAERIIDMFDTDAYTVNGIVRWKSNNSIPPRDVLDLWFYVGKAFDINESIDLSDKETSIFLQDYRERMKNYSPSHEELVEMKSAFGSGTCVVDIITGNQIYL